MIHELIHALRRLTNRQASQLPLDGQLASQSPTRMHPYMIRGPLHTSSTRKLHVCASQKQSARSRLIYSMRRTEKPSQRASSSNLENGRKRIKVLTYIWTLPTHRNTHTYTTQSQQKHNPFSQWVDIQQANYKLLFSDRTSISLS